MNVSSSIIVALPRRRDDRINVFLRVHTKQVIIGGGSRLDHFAALFLEGRGHRLQHAGALGALGVAGRRDVIDESLRADED